MLSAMVLVAMCFEVGFEDFELRVLNKKNLGCLIKVVTAVCQRYLGEANYQVGELGAESELETSCEMRQGTNYIFGKYDKAERTRAQIEQALSRIGPGQGRLSLPKPLGSKTESGFSNVASRLDAVAQLM